MISEKFSAELSAIRWIAAFFVVISHVRTMLFVDYADVSRKNILTEAFYFVTGFGHEAVIVFFVISGFLVGGIAARKLSAGRFDAKDFAIHRFSRIYIVLIPALLAGYALDHAGFSFFDDAALYAHSERYRVNGLLSRQMGWDTFVGNALMLQDISVTVAGSNGPLWSLAYEWWYYCIFFCILVLLAPKRSIPTRFACLVAIAALATLLPPKVLVWFLIWLTGVAIAFYPSRWRAPPPWLAYGVLLGALAWARVRHANPYHSLLYDFAHDFVVAAACFMLLISLMKSRDDHSQASAFHHAMADFSYTTYLVHFPFLAFAVSFLNSVFGIPFFRQPATGNFIYFAVLLGMAYLYTYAFSLITEKHTQRLRAALHSLFRAGRRKPLPGTPASPDLPPSYREKPKKEAQYPAQVRPALAPKIPPSSKPESRP
jgi:peptidoglycan/LPS O-acetylase OafA/YrhL